VLGHRRYGGKRLNSSANIDWLGPWLNTRLEIRRRFAPNIIITGESGKKFLHSKVHDKTVNPDSRMRSRLQQGLVMRLGFGKIRVLVQHARITDHIKLTYNISKMLVN